jgi:hypothetical protein
MKKRYVTMRDIDYRGHSWWTNRPRLLTPEQVANITAKFGNILKEYEYTPKRMVILDGKEMTWSEYMKLRLAKKKP